MKKFFLCLVFGILCLGTYAQESITLHQGAHMRNFNVTDIDSISHNNGNELTIHKGDGSLDTYALECIDSISFGRYSPMTIIANINDPEILMYQLDEHNLVHYYGVKDEEGRALAINMIVFENSEEGLSKICLDEKMRPTRFYTNVGVIYDFMWYDDSTGVLTGFDTNTNTTIKVAFDRRYEDGVAPSKRFRPYSTIDPEYTREGVFSYDIQPLITSINDNDILAKLQNNRNQSCFVAFRKCDEYYNPKDVYLSIYKASGGWVTDLHNYQQNATGQYLFSIPDEAYPSIDLGELADYINIAFESIGSVSNYLSSTGGDIFLCSAISIGLTALTEGAFAVCAPYFTEGCIAFNRMLTLLNYANTGGLPPDNPTWTGQLVEWLRNGHYLERVYTDNLLIIPVVDFVGDIVDQTYVSPEQSVILINVEEDGDPSVDEFYCSPAAPVEYQSYVAYATLRCIPIGSTVTMSIQGTDGYSKEETTEVTSVNSVVTMTVPGSYEGVQDALWVVVKHPNGSILAWASASLYFH